MRQLYDHQHRAIALLRESLRSGHKRPMLTLPTGAGKTVIASEIVRTAREKGNRILFIVDAISLIDQTVQRFEEHGLYDIGVIQAHHMLTDHTMPIQVASIQTLRRRIPPGFSFAIVDEAHTQHREVFNLMAEHPDKPFIGLSATPWSKGLGNHYDDLLIPVRMQELIDQGYLCGFQVYAPSHPDLRGVKTTAGDYNEADLAKVMGDQALVADIVTTWKQRAVGRPTLCFCVDRAHAQTMRDRFEAGGVRCGYIDGETPAVEREEIQHALEDGRIDVVTSVGCLTRGVDWSIGCIILARPTKSAALAVQMIGRGLRVNTGRAAGDCVVLDHTDTVLRLGFPTDIHRTSLCTAQKGDKQAVQDRPPPTPKECPGCKRLTTTRCQCGYEAPRQASLLTEGTGELAELIAGREFEQHCKPKKPKPMEKREWYAQALGLAKSRGKPDSYALALFRAKFGEWPHGKNGITPSNPSPEIIAYDRSRRIAWSKRQKAA